MDWNAQIGRDVRALDGIVATLLALACLAERAAGALLPVRWLVLMFIRQADAVATEFVACPTGGAARGKWLARRMSVHHGSQPGDAIDLALSLSRLAGAVAAIVAQLRRQAFLRGRRPSGMTGLGALQEISGALAISAPQVEGADTS